MSVRILIPAALIAVSALVVSGCSGQSGDSADSAVAPNASICTNATQIDTWSTKRKIGQVIMGAVNSEQGAAGITKSLRAVQKRQVTGVNFLGENASIYNKNQLAQVIDAAGEIPPLLAIDQEGGQVQRLRSVIGDSPSARDMTDLMTAEQAESEGWRIGKAMAARSLNMDFAPVVDVGTRAIGDRTFSDDPDEVTEYAGSFAAGLRRADVIPTLKHFPGLGSATGNTDFQTATTPPLNELKKKDLLPYEFLLDEGPVAVMFANAVVPGLSKGAPASLSPAAYKLLRKDYGFGGVAITDSLSAAAISNEYLVPEAVEKAIVAGADIALWDDLAQVAEVTKQLRKAVKAGRLATERLDEAVGRVLELKSVDLCSGR